MRSMFFRMLTSVILGLFSTMPPHQRRDAFRLLVNKFDLKSDALRYFYFEGNLNSARFKKIDVETAIKFARARFPDSPLYYLTDEYPKYGAIPGLKLIKEVDLGSLQHSTGPHVFICAFESDEKLIRALREIKKLPTPYFYTPSAYYPTARYFHRNDMAREVLIAEQAIDLPKFEVADFENIIQALDITADVPGDYIEIGVYQGRSAHLALHYMRQKGIRRKAYLVDIFEGFGYEGAVQSADALWMGSHTDTSIQGVQEFLAEYDSYQIHKLNIITDDLPTEIGEVAVCNIDVDMYEAVLAGLNKVAPRMVSAGIIVVEDQGHTPALAGAYLAVVEFLASPVARDFIPLHMASGQLFLIRK